LGAGDPEDQNRSRPIVIGEQAIQGIKPLTPIGVGETNKCWEQAIQKIKPLTPTGVGETNKCWEQAIERIKPFKTN